MKKKSKWQKFETSKRKKLDKNYDKKTPKKAKKILPKKITKITCCVQISTKSKFRRYFMRF